MNMSHFEVKTSLRERNRISHVQREENNSDKTLKHLEAATLVKFLGCLMFWEVLGHSFQSNLWVFVP